MPKSLKCKLSDLRHKRLITDEEYQEMIKKLNGHDREIRNKAIDDLCNEFRKDWEEQCENDMEDCINWYDWLIACAKQLKGE